MPRIDIMSLVGSAVPAPLRADGYLACWYVVVEGVQRSGPYTSLDVATASKSIWQQRFGRG
ncbi:hypothetical protein IB229_11905 [Pseudomonas sp. PDM14]|uniref:hypothetical protein n=1 Tax=Pseudomonas sp. PDM14 TaxID=2769288 RepID=UPI001782261E|nr:hypothetical protein [Pseudomonas sp. PDM14]MBD9483681.1 hypothetical protein [Pseudomonas sp. PDM14]